MKSQSLHSYILSLIILLSIPARADFTFDPTPIRQKVESFIKFSRDLELKNEKVIEGAAVRGDNRTLSEHRDKQRKRDAFNCMGNNNLENRLQSAITTSCGIDVIEQQAITLSNDVAALNNKITIVQEKLKETNANLQHQSSFNLKKAKQDLYNFEEYRQNLEIQAKSLITSSRSVQKGVDGMFEEASCQQAYDEVFEHHIATLMAYGCSPVIIEYWVEGFIKHMSSTDPRRPLGQLNEAQSIYVEARKGGAELVSLLYLLENTIESLRNTIQALESKGTDEVPGVS